MHYPDMADTHHHPDLPTVASDFSYNGFVDVLKCERNAGIGGSGCNKSNLKETKETLP